MSENSATDDNPSVPEAPHQDAIDFLGASADKMIAFANLLASQGERRGLIGPRELPKLWDRHIINCASLASAIGDVRTIADVGSGAGLPGIVIGILKPQANVVLIETMERRCAWLSEVKETLDLANIEVLRGRAEEFVGAREYDVVTARAVAALDKLARWCFPLVKVGGELVLLKGQRAQEEVESASKVLGRYGARDVTIEQRRAVPSYSAATVLRIRRGK
ncbi:16S rRNA (guanine(527)-N(7))-methyltransferase RsmG [Rarobacter faecitabidus]|uniref:Ribosomal RNA small subunit methyltransferase G n=1 Tax=Rarobacter faecitabidus TaxID=13243 RepID=A0A542ZPC6_RARFA|nr:16S rRNA (guanine(527)-N(7))-methyltransferase RsmG [Rarobacter faecitabidus]TQL62213.1 16S rRNA m(7)G-527 methyltransferase [Rarobacter faecitabidus]